MKDNVIAQKSKNFAIDVINAYKYLFEVKREYVMSKQLLRSGTSIGANVAEANYAQSEPDFLSKCPSHSKKQEKPRIGSNYFMKPIISTKKHLKNYIPIAPR